jgi:acetyl esterase/lipase
MKIRHMARLVAALGGILSAASLFLSGCSSGRPAVPTQPARPAATSLLATALPRTLRPATPDHTTASTSSLLPDENMPETSWKDFIIGDFSAVHAPVDQEGNRQLIFGNLRVDQLEAPPAKLSAFLGRWEGVENASEGYVPSQAVLFVQQIDEQRGKAYLWAGEQLQYPFYVKEVLFRVVPGDPPAIEWQGDLTGAPGGKGLTGRFRFSYDREDDLLRGGLYLLPDEQPARSIELQRGSSFFVYRDFLKFLQTRRIYFHEYADPTLQPHGWGYLVYLPEGYEADPGQTWPLLVFLIGTGERGQSAYLLTRHGPLKEIIAGRSLPFVIVTPMLNVSPDFRSFPETYLDGVFDEILADYQVDRDRVYLTGISMGGEATFRYALHRPELFAAIVPIAAFDARFFPAGQREGFTSSGLPFERLKDVPVWAFHGGEDEIIPLPVARQTVDALAEAGVDVRLTVLEGRGHDAWTEIYAGQELYDWLLVHSKPK